jgi:hypothetical protein
VIENNKIENAHIGTQLSGNYKYYNVFKNEIVTNAGVGISNAGFGMMAMMYPAIGIDIKQNNPPFMSGQMFLVDENTIRLPYYAGKGISNQGVNASAEIKNNNIYFTVPQGTSYPVVPYNDPCLYGIFNTNSNDFTLQNNLVDGQYTQNVYNTTYSKAFYFETSKQMTINCNRARATKQGLYAWGDNATGKTKIKNNKFKFNLNPLYTLDNGSAQPGTFGNIGNGIVDNNNFWLYNMPNGNGWLQNNIYKVWRNSNIQSLDIINTSTNLLLQSESGSSGGAGNPYAYGVNNPPGMTSSDIECPAVDFGNSQPPPNPIVISNGDIDIAISIAAQQELYINYAQVGAWMNHRWLYEKLHDDESLRQSSQVLTAFYNDYQNGSIGTIRNIELALATLYDYSGSEQDFITEYNNAVNINNSLVTTEGYELNVQTINNIDLKLLRWGVDSLSEAEKLELEIIANLCPFVGGSAVYKARSLYALINPMAQYNDRFLCIQGQNKNGGISFINLDSLYEVKTKEEADKLTQLQGVNEITRSIDYNIIENGEFEDILIYPNPASNFLTISNFKESGTFELYNALGQIILSYSLNNKQVQKIIIPKLSNGIYSYKILGVSKTHFGKLKIIQND